MEKSKNILIVKDEGIIALQLKSALEQMGHTVVAT
jgi:CheY-like chemotaxis protein